MNDGLSHVHHYVPEWYQKRFLEAGADKLHLLDLLPDTVKLPNGRKFTHNDYRLRPPSKCFYSDDLYMMRFGPFITDRIERHFFGMTDRRGSVAVNTFSRVRAFDKGFAQTQGEIPPYMGAQRFRTPRGLDWLKQQTGTVDHNRALGIMANTFQQHTTMWAEGIWEVVMATKTTTKFIISDEPVTFYNSRLPPSFAKYPGTEELANVGTRTIFPLGPESCLIITHLQFTRDPEQNPVKARINARKYDQVMMYAGNVQFGREIEEDEVLRLNLILKMKATRYIAAGRKDWLYPEKHLKRTGWAVLDDDWFLFPNLWKVPFTKAISMGYRDGSHWAADEYGHHPGHPKFYDDQQRRERERITKELAMRKWAKLRRGKCLSHTYEHGDVIHDRFMNEYLDSIAKKK